DGALGNGFTPDFSGEAQSIAVTALNTRNTTFDLSATKMVEGSASFVARDFDFQVRDAAGDPVAYGKASVDAKGVATNVEFYEEPSCLTKIDDWTKVLVSGETYSLVEMNAGAYSVTYAGGSGALGNEFVADFAHDAPAIEFSVTNTLDTGFDFAGSKTVSGGANFTARDFTFELRDAQGDPVAYGKSSVNVKGQATDIDFFLDDACTIEIADWTSVLVEGETYTLVETNQGAYTVTYMGGDGPDHNQFTADFAHDATAIEFSVDNCLNYRGIDPTLTGFKVLEGRDLRDGEFTFTAEVVKGDPNEIVGNGYANGKISTTNKADGTITFPSLYIEHAGTYILKIYEEKGSASGVFYTDAVFYASVTAHDVGGGILNEELTYWRTYDARTGTVSDQVNPKDVKFVNKYGTRIVKTGDDAGGAAAALLTVAAGSGAVLAASKLRKERKAKRQA
ncbi:Spy0128 family protein, partial [Gordonibacter massiliensis (ex Traore et al. 2017)]|uniref:Spy0128 family protein n=1 Tax=Gordonibacter massiliensis (ex Traore et al. 2017) TaxID=1841863 RepID=UPI001C8CB7C1